MKYSFCLGQWSYVSKTVSLPVDTDSQSGGDGFGAMGAMGGGMGAAAMGTGMGLMGGMPMRQQGGCVLIVSNLEETRVTPDVLFTLFGVYGDVLRVKILFNKKDTALIQVTFSFFFLLFRSETEARAFVSIYGASLNPLVGRFVLSDDGAVDGADLAPVFGQSSSLRQADERQSVEKRTRSANQGRPSRGSRADQRLHRCDENRVLYIFCLLIVFGFLCTGWSKKPVSANLTSMRYATFYF